MELYLKKHFIMRVLLNVGFSPFDFCKVPVTISQASVKGVDFHLMTSHLESTAEHSAERVRQLRTSLKCMKDAPNERTVIFGGDLNMRDKEVFSI